MIDSRTHTNIVIDSVERALAFADTIREYRYCRNKAIYQNEQIARYSPNAYPANTKHHIKSAAEWNAKAATHALILKHEYNLPSDIVDAHDGVLTTIFGGAA
jgi:hypothetical protein